jgi:hypothetical protein
MRERVTRQYQRTGSRSISPAFYGAKVEPGLYLAMPFNSFTELTNQVMIGPPEEITPDILYQTGIEVFRKFEDYEG